MRLSAPLILSCLALSLGAQAATLKPFSTLAGPVVRLSDIWEGVKDDKPLGPAPAPGGRITVPTAQLAAIARQFGVDWQPGSSGDRSILERPGRALTRDDIKPALSAALTSTGTSSDADLELAAFTAAPLPADAKPQVTVTQLDLDQVSGRFSAMLEVAADDVPSTQLRVTGRVQEMVDLPVARRRIMPGEVVAAADLEWAHLRTTVARGEFVRLPAEAVGLAAKRSIAPNQPIPAADLGRPVIVQKGEAMTLTLQSPGLLLTAQGIATAPGGIGEHIRVLNVYSRVTVETEITGPGNARVLPGTTRAATNVVAAR
jgi:flagella basal body P-ring formation protein FlgA